MAQNLAVVNLRGGWDAAWSPISSVLGTGLLKIVAAVGVLIVVSAFAKWIWDKRRGGGGNSSTLLWSLAIGALLTGPTVVIPVALWLFDGAANVVLKLFSNNGAK